MKLKCPNKKCLYEWDYKGNSKFYACCPICRHQVKILQKKLKGKPLCFGTCSLNMVMCKECRFKEACKRYRDKIQEKK